MNIKKDITNLWHNQNDCTPEQFEHLVHREADADKPRHYRIVGPNFEVEEHFDNIGNLEYITDHVLVFYGYHKDTKEPLFCIDRRRKFNDRDKWIWLNLEGCEDWEEIMWMEIPKGFDLNKFQENEKYTERKGEGVLCR